MKLLQSPNFFKISREDYDWRGHGMYFWENNKERALLWANEKHPKEKGNDKTLRFLDCTVIEYTHQFFKSNNENPFDSVRAAFFRRRSYL